MLCVALFEADAPPSSDKAPAIPNAVTTLLRPLPFEVCFERDIVSDLHFGPEPRPKCSLALRRVQALSPLQQLRQLGDVDRDAASFVPGQKIGSRLSPQLLLEVEIAKRLPVLVAHDEAGIHLLDGPWRWEAASGHGEDDCERLGFYVNGDPEFPDLNRLSTDCVWDANTQRWAQSGHGTDAMQIRFRRELTRRRLSAGVLVKSSGCLQALGEAMRRRDFILAGGATIAWSLAARAQQSNQLRRIGVLFGVAETDLEGHAWDAAFRKRLAELGWIDGRNVTVATRWNNGSMDRTKLLATELVGTSPDVLVAVTTPVTAALQHETHTIPIVFASVSDPVGSGFVATLHNPGGNITGFINMEASLSGKWIEMLREIAPQVSRVAILFNPQTRAPGSLLFRDVPIRCEGTFDKVYRGSYSQFCRN